MNISLIAAAAENNVIGRGNQLPWHLPDDLKFFRTKTEEHPIILGRRNFESIGRPLPNRHNIIVTRQPDYKAEGCSVVGSIDDAIDLASQFGTDEIFVIGGGEIYEQALPRADRIYLTRVHAEIEGDVFFPALSKDDWKEVSSEHHDADDDHPYAFTFLVYDRR